MKIIEKDNYSLYTLENYKDNLNSSVNDIVKNYKEIINEFLKFILENLKIKNNIYSRFIILRGIDTVTNVFNIILYYTNNIDLTFYHCQKSYYYYVEFIEQISADQHVFLQLNSRDASTYVFKKTIYELNRDIKKNMKQCNKEIKNKLDKANDYIYFFKNILELIFQKFDLENQTLEKKMELIEKIYLTLNFIVLLKLDHHSNKILIYFFEKIYIIEKDISVDLYIEIIFNTIKQCIKNINKSIENIEKNIINYDSSKIEITNVDLVTDKFISSFLTMK
jgi:hypothetical protein